MTAILLLSCPDQKGLVASISNFISDNGGNILNLDEHVDSDENMFFIRVEWEIGGLKFGKDELSSQFQPLADQFNGKLNLLRKNQNSLFLYLSTITLCKKFCGDINLVNLTLKSQP